MRVVDTLEPGQVDPFQDHPVEHRAATSLRDAMLADKIVTFDYDGKPRQVEVHAIGVSTKDKSLVMRGYQINDKAMWKLFTIAKIYGLAVDTVPSDAPREGYSQGDRQMGPVLCELKV